VGDEHVTDLMLANPLFLSRDPVEAKLMTPYFPLGLLYLAAVARGEGYSVSLFDGMFQEGEDAFAAKLAQDQPKVVGISVLSTVRGMAERLADIARRQGAIVVVGGADPTGRPQSYLERRDTEHPVADVVVIGEGERTLLELLPVLLN
jgi:radical SAM superfamily enzyme YgiQ (UPF0313 family)